MATEPKAGAVAVGGAAQVGAVPEVGEGGAAVEVVDLTRVRTEPVKYKKKLVKCPICLTVFLDEPANRSGVAGSPGGFVVLRCAHVLCCNCFVGYVGHRVSAENDAFPMCPLPYCSAVIPNRILHDYLCEDTQQKLHVLQQERQARAIDDTPLFCTNSNTDCGRQPMLPTIYSNSHGNSYNGNIEDVATVVCCPNCPNRTCVACAQDAHTGKPCDKPLFIGDDKVLQAKLYRAYAVGRVASCERCGRHIERNGGCDEMKCACGHTFKFVAFRSETQVAAAIASSRAIAIDVSEDANDNNTQCHVNIRIPAAVRRVGCHVLMFFSIVLWIIYVFGLVIFTSASSTARNERAFLVLLVVFPVVWLLCYCVVPLIATMRRFRHLWDVENDIT